MNGVKEEIPFGNFIIEKPQNEEVKSKTLFVGYDYMIKFNTKYKDTNTYPVTLQEFFTNLCAQVGLEAGTERIVNAEYRVLGNPFTNNETCKTVLGAIAQLCGGFAKIGRDNKVHITTLNKNEVADTIDGNNYDSSFKKNNVWGEVNSLVLRLSYDVEGENTVRENPESIVENGLTEITISGNEFLIDEAERNKVIPELWDSLNGIKYLPFSTNYYGYPYLDSGDKIKILDNKDVKYDSYVLNHQFTYNGSFSGKITTEALTKTETKYKNRTDIKTRFRNVELKVDKINGTINLLAEEVDDSVEQVSNMLIQIGEIASSVSENAKLTNTEIGMTQITILDAITGPLLKLRIIGNNSVFKPTYLSDDLYLSDDSILGGDSLIEINGVQYDLGIETELRQLGSVYDEYIYDYSEKTSKIIRRVGVYEETGETYELETEQIEELEHHDFQFINGENTVKILNYSANLEITYAQKNAYTDLLATKAELKSEITETSTEITQNVTKIIEDETGVLEEEIGELKVTSSEISAEVSKKVGKNDFTKASIVAKINDNTSEVKIEADKIDLNGYVTIADLSGPNKTTIDGSNIKTGTISSDKIDTETMIIGDNINLIGGTTPTWLSGQVPSPSGDSSNPIAYFGAFNLGQMNMPRASVGGEIWDNGEMYVRRLYTESGQNSEGYMGFIKTSLSNDSSSSINYIVGHTSSGGRGINVNTYAESFDIYAETSDERLKENIMESTVDGLSIINAIRLISFNWKDSGKFQKLGFSAQQLQTICEDFVNAVKQPEGAELEDILQVRDFNIMPYITKSIQELNGMIDKLQEENEVYKTMIEDLNTRIAKLENKEENT